MLKSFLAPSRYYQGCSLLSNTYKYVAHIGRHFIVIVDDNVRKIVEPRFGYGFQESGSRCTYIKFNGESTLKEICRISQEITTQDYDGIIGAGGGKALDVAKLVGNMCGIPVITVPTVASSDSACSCMASIYSENGSFMKIDRVKESPAVVLVDTEIIASAPPDYFIAGMGEAYATYYGARACQRSGVVNYTGGERTYTALSLASICKESLLKYGGKAVRDMTNGRISLAVDRIIETNIYLSGVGYENNGCAAAQAVYSGLFAAKKPIHVLQGKGTAFGLLVQLIMEYSESGKWNKEEWDETIRFYRDVGLPRNFKHIGIECAEDFLITSIAKFSCEKNSNMHNMPFTVTEGKVKRALEKIKDMNLE